MAPLCKGRQKKGTRNRHTFPSCSSRSLELPSEVLCSQRQPSKRGVVFMVFSFWPSVKKVARKEATPRRAGHHTIHAMAIRVRYPMFLRIEFRKQFLDRLCRSVILSDIKNSFIYEIHFILNFPPNLYLSRPPGQVQKVRRFRPGRVLQ